MIRANKTVIEIEEVTDPDDIARSHEQDKRHRRNIEWLQSHWKDVVPQARGKFLAVACEEAHIAETADEAWSWAKEKHPEDNGAFVRYVYKKKGPRIYASRRFLGN